ncbi:MAG: T9SS C-terminal target domain-containing protein [Calditrichaeota bacterium]|nr:T9SS type A sorting domain-containing protein [Calditrichota bacterium]RQW03049.1 MAG: T9SS C-terminal target domain-containing protein [Calditrichota bacterium]
MGANYPNPFNPSTTIEFTLPEQSEVVLMVYDVLGRQVAVLAEGEKPAGTYRIRWQAGNIPGGVYFYRLQAGSFTRILKMVLLH